MDKEEIKKTLEKQLLLLSERSEKAAYESDLRGMTEAMVLIVSFLLSDDEISDDEIVGFSEKLAELQAEHHETNYQLAKEIGVHQSTIKNWLDGTKPHPRHLKKVAEHYGVSREFLLGDDEAKLNGKYPKGNEKSILCEGKKKGRATWTKSQSTERCMFQKAARQQWPRSWTGWSTAWCVPVIPAFGPGTFKPATARRCA